MNTLKIIRDGDFGFDTPAPGAYSERRAARAVVFDTYNNIALLHATKKQYHKLPGGGIEKGEDIFEALRRETLEEIGCDVQNMRELGIIEEYRDRFPEHQTSFCYLADLLGEKGESHLEADEMADGFETIWLSLEEAIETLEGEQNIDHYEAKFMCLRDLTFLKEAARVLSSSLTNPQNNI